MSRDLPAGGHVHNHLQGRQGAQQHNHLPAAEGQPQERGQGHRGVGGERGTVGQEHGLGRVAVVGQQQGGAGPQVEDQEDSDSRPGAVVHGLGSLSAPPPGPGHGQQGPADGNEGAQKVGDAGEPLEPGGGGADLEDQHWQQDGLEEGAEQRNTGRQGGPVDGLMILRAGKRGPAVRAWRIGEGGGRVGRLVPGLRREACGRAPPWRGGRGGGAGPGAHGASRRLKVGTRPSAWARTNRSTRLEAGTPWAMNFLRIAPRYLLTVFFARPTLRATKSAVAPEA